MSAKKTGTKHPLFGKTRSAETRAKISAAQGTAIFMYDLKGLLIKSFFSANEAGKYCCHKTIIRNAKNGRLFRNKWILSNIVK